MNLKKLTKMCASVLLAIMVVGMPLYLGTMQVFQKNGDYVIRPPELGPVEGLIFNEPPVCIMQYPTTIQMTAWTDLYLGEWIDLDTYFWDSDPEIRLSYELEYPDDLVSVELDKHYLSNVETFGGTGEFTITVLAFDGESYTGYDISLIIEPRHVMSTDEDVPGSMDVTEYVRYDTADYDVSSQGDFYMELELPYMEQSTLNLYPNQDWYGEGTISLWAYETPYCTPYPWPVDQQQSENEGDDSPMPGFTYRMLEFDVEVNSVNDPPKAIVEPNYRFTITTDTAANFMSPFYIDSLFNDVDSELAYSWTTDRGLVSIDMGKTEINAISSKGIIGDDTIEFVAFDGEYAVKNYIRVSVIPVESVKMMEDELQMVNLGEYVDPLWQRTQFIGSENLEASVPDELVVEPRMQLTPAQDWFGENFVNVIVEPVIYSIILPPLHDTIYNSLPEPIIPQPDIMDYGFYKFNIDVAPVNDPPYLLPHLPITMEEDEVRYNAFNIAECFGDVDSTLQYAIVGGSEIRLNPELAYGGQVNLVPEADWFGSGAVTIMAWDEEYEVTQDIYIWVSPVNDVPFSTEAPETILLDEDSVVVLNISDYISDVDDALWYSFGINDTNCSVELDESTWNLTVVPNDNWNGIIGLTIYGSDSEFSIARNLTLDVVPVNDPPEIISRPSLTTMEGETLSLDVGSMIVDIDSELEFFVYSLNGKFISERTRDSEYTLTPQSRLWNGNDILRVVASDGEYVVTLDLELEVIPVNNAPLLRTNLTQITMQEDTTLFLNVGDMFEDEDGDAIEFGFMSSANLALSFDRENSVLCIRPSENWNGISNIHTTAYDGYAWETVEIIVTVTPVNDPPEMISSIPPVILESGNSTVVWLDKHFRDIDSNAITIDVMAYGNISVEPLETFGSYRLGTSENWEGTESLVIRVSDGESILETELTVTAQKGTVIVETSSADMGFLQSISWMGAGMVVAVAAYAMYNISENRNARARTTNNKGRVL